ncbi:MAG: preprotein translocase subunit SecG [Planctomycetia bacterium]|jgi:preprotein translocase subunit SecG|nr:preprotein translocase subunit SecG [Planctomycetia bacterium]MCC7313832.1 preprotein translocase subunit SecG [Planctomycetota bacterium]OQZ06536.1 MAG: preprotein translocase subunit SecG [Planctomycetes bacterium UTPLA1]
MSTLVLASFGTTIVTILLTTVSVMLIGLVLLQKNRGSGLSGAFGGVGGNTAFGTKTGDVLTVITVAFTALFLVLSVIGVYVFVPAKLVTTPPATLMPDAGTTGTDAAPVTEGATPVDAGSAAPAQSGEAPAGSATPPPPAESTTPPAAPSESTTPGGQ